MLRMWRSMFLVSICAANILQGSGSTYSMDFEHPNLTYWNRKYYAYVNITAQRHNRRDTTHYVSIHSKCLTEFGNEIQLNVYVYEFLSNEYRRSFLEVHYRLCEWIQREKTFMPYILKYLTIKTCPFPKGEYHFVNMSLPDMPLLKTFPFSKGRLFITVSNYQLNERVLEAYLDIFIKEKAQGRK